MNGLKELAGEVAHQHEWTRQAKEVTRNQQNQNQRAAKVNPTQSGRQIFRCERRPEQSVYDHYYADDEQWNLE